MRVGHRQALIPKPPFLSRAGCVYACKIWWDEYDASIFAGIYNRLFRCLSSATCDRFVKNCHVRSSLRIISCPLCFGCINADKRKYQVSQAYSYIDR